MKNQTKPTESSDLGCGLIVVRRSALCVASKTEVDDFLERHYSGDWGLIGFVGQTKNDQALINGELIYSVFESKSRDLLLIVTDGGRTTTCVVAQDDPIWEEVLDANQPSMATH